MAGSFPSTPTTGQIHYVGTIKYVYNGSNWVAYYNDNYLASRDQLSATTISIANNADDNINIPGHSAYALLKIQTSGAAWVRVYTDNAARAADAARAEGSDPGLDAGIVAEVITTGAETVIIAPGAIGFNNENPVVNIIPCAVRNKTGATGTITVTLTALQMEI